MEAGRALALGQDAPEPVQERIGSAQRLVLLCHPKAVSRSV